MGCLGPIASASAWRGAQTRTCESQSPCFGPNARTANQEPGTDARGGGEGSLNIPAIRYSAALEGRYYNRYVGAQVIPRDVSLAEFIELGQREG